MLLRAGRAGETTPVRRVKIATNEKATRGERGGESLFFSLEFLRVSLLLARDDFHARTLAYFACSTILG